MTARWWLIVYNNPEVELRDFLQLYMDGGARYIVGQPEVGKKCGTYHYQCAVNFPSPVRGSYLSSIFKSCHYEIVNHRDAYVRYCQKSDTAVGEFIELGTKPFQMNSKVCWDNVWQLAKEGKVEEIPANIRIRCYNSIKQIQKDHMVM